MIGEGWLTVKVSQLADSQLAKMIPIRAFVSLPRNDNHQEDEAFRIISNAS
jgi:hypothetical protein